MSSFTGASENSCPLQMVFSYADFCFSLLLLTLTAYTPTIITAYKYPNMVNDFRPPCCCFVGLGCLLSPLLCPVTPAHFSETVSGITSFTTPSLIFQEN